MKIRLMGTEDECRTVAGRLAAIVDILEVSEPRANRGGSLLVRVYVEAGVPASSPGQVVPWPTAAERDKAAAALRAMSADDRAMLIWQLAVRPGGRARLYGAPGQRGGRPVTASAWALISPAGELTWRPLADTPKVEAIAPGALDSAFVTGPLRVMASDIALVAPDHYLPNLVAERVIAALSGGRILQPWRGHVALVQYEQDAATGEWLWPGEMSPAWAERITGAVGAAGGTEAPQ